MRLLQFCLYVWGKIQLQMSKTMQVSFCKQEPTPSISMNFAQ